MTRGNAVLTGDWYIFVMKIPPHNL